MTIKAFSKIFIDLLYMDNISLYFFQSASLIWTQILLLIFCCNIWKVSVVEGINSCAYYNKMSVLIVS